MTTRVDPALAWPLERKVALLARPDCYPERPARVETIETHMSWVFLTATRAYKLKKPVRHAFLDYSTLAARERYCREEVRVNQPLAASVYLGVAALAVDADGRAALGGRGTPIEWLVVMRRLPAACLLDAAIRAGTATRARVAAAAERLAEFYGNAEPVALSGAAYRRACRARIEENRAVLDDRAHGLPPALVAEVHDWLVGVLEREAAAFARRADEGRIVDGHGDLRPEHVALETPPVVIDRLEFDRSLRLLDAVEELSFLAMECARLGAPWVRAILFDAYARATGDIAPEALVRFYTVHRACVRARLAALHTVDLPPAAWPKWRGRAREYLDLARARVSGA
ncbi:MAG TPA: hypothetical protein VF203_14495 [Burkholderiales bacterium]